MPGQFSNRMGVGAVIHTLTGGVLSIVNFHDAGLHIFNTTTTAGGHNTLALPDGTHKGQMSVGKVDTDGGATVIVTPTNFMDGATITLDTAFDSYNLMWDGTEWVALGTTTGTIA